MRSAEKGVIKMKVTKDVVPAVDAAEKQLLALTEKLEALKTTFAQDLLNRNK